MMRMKSLLIDDERMARLRLERLLRDQEKVEIVGEAENGLEAIAQIERLSPDLIFLDVQMPGLDGFEVLRALPPGRPLPLVIFVTGFHEYALRAFEANALAYLLKPVEVERLTEMVERAWRLYSFADERQGDGARIKHLASTVAPRLEQIVARKLDRLLLLDPADIYFFYIDHGIVRAKTAHETFWVNYQLGELEEALQGVRFFRAHRSTLVNLGHVKEIRPDFRSSFALILADPDQTTIQVSERQARVLRERIPGL
jgi:two-component system, LytTR family, response regulator